VGGLAEPEDFLLHLGQPLEAALHGKVAAGDHHSAAGRCHRSQEKVGQVLEGLPGLDFQHDSQVRGAERGQAVLQIDDIRRFPDEGLADHVGVFSDERQVGQVLGGEGRHPKGTVG